MTAGCLAPANYIAPHDSSREDGRRPPPRTVLLVLSPRPRSSSSTLPNSDRLAPRGFLQPDSATRWSTHLGPRPTRMSTGPADEQRPRASGEARRDHYGSGRPARSQASWCMAHSRQGRVERAIWCVLLVILGARSRGIVSRRDELVGEATGAVGCAAGAHVGVLEVVDGAQGRQGGRAGLEVAEEGRVEDEGG